MAFEEARVDCGNDCEESDSCGVGWGWEERGGDTIPDGFGFKREEELDC